MPIDVIEHAYELTVNATNKASMAYADKILENWFKSGINTVEKAKESEIEYKKTKQNDNQPKASSFDDDEFFEAALKRSYENIKITKNSKKTAPLQTDNGYVSDNAVSAYLLCLHFAQAKGYQRNNDLHFSRVHCH